MHSVWASIMSRLWMNSKSLFEQLYRFKILQNLHFGLGLNISLPKRRTCHVNTSVSRPGQSQRLVYKHCRHLLIDSFGWWPFSFPGFTAPPRLKDYEALQASAPTLVSQRWTNCCSLVWKLFWINFGTQSKLRHTAFRISKKNWGL